MKHFIVLNNKISKLKIQPFNKKIILYVWLWSLSNIFWQWSFILFFEKWIFLWACFSGTQKTFRQIKVLLLYCLDMNWIFLPDIISFSLTSGFEADLLELNPVLQTLQINLKSSQTAVFLSNKIFLFFLTKLYSWLCIGQE